MLQVPVKVRTISFKLDTTATYSFVSDSVNTVTECKQFNNATLAYRTENLLGLEPYSLQGGSQAVTYASGT